MIGLVFEVEGPADDDTTLLHGRSGKCGEADHVPGRQNARYRFRVVAVDCQLTGRVWFEANVLQPDSPGRPTEASR